MLTAPTEWGRKIREARGPKSQADLAVEVGVDQATISRIENGAGCSDRLKLRIATALGVSVGDLFGWPS